MNRAAFSIRNGHIGRDASVQKASAKRLDFTEAPDVGCEIDDSSLHGFATLPRASRLVSAAMLPLAAGLALDIRIVARLATGESLLATAIGVVVFALFVVLWFVFPQWRGARRHAAKR